MNTRLMAVATTATITLLAACSKAPETAAPAAPTADAAAGTTHAEHDTTATPAPTGLARTPAPAGATVFIVSPKDGETVTTPVKVVFGISGMGLAPAGEKNDNAGHHHLLIDTELADASLPIPADEKHVHFGKAQTEAEVALAPGAHTLQLVLGDYLHIPFDPVIASQKITINVN
ncbi:MAG TPA: DUF4399 domain-containing protein [Steroidobacteraceae bacterium]|nr:DUF4399 domain-containing protein [Steroidobacteraceae bacterium]